MAARAESVGQEDGAVQKSKPRGSVDGSEEPLLISDVGKEKSHAMLMAMAGGQFQWTGIRRGIGPRLGAVEKEKAQQASVPFLGGDASRPWKRVLWVGAQRNEPGAKERGKVENGHGGGGIKAGVDEAL